MQDADETRDKVSAYIQFMEYSEDGVANGQKRTVKKGTATQKERAQAFINGKNKKSGSLKTSADS